MTIRSRTTVLILSLLTLLVGCGPAAPTATPIPPSATPVPVEPTDAPPTATPESRGSPEPTVAPPPAGSDEGLIAFVSTRDGNGEIYVMAADGSNPTRLTDYRQWDGFPDWSPDGTQVAYYSYLNSRSWVIIVMDVDGSNPRQLTDGGLCDGAPHWSPDGTRIAYSSSANCSGDDREIYVIDADGGNPRNLSNNEADDLAGTWSPDSTQMVFASNRDGNYELYTMDADGSNVRRLTDNDADDYAPAWSPDGTQIAFYSDRDGNDEIYVMDADGGNSRNLSNHPSADWFPRWSPDGTQITFSSQRDGNLEIYVMDADGGNVRRLTDNPADDFNSVWQPRPAGGDTPPAQTDTWVRTYEGDPVSAAFDAVPAGDGGYLLVGSTNHTHQNTAAEDIHLIKIDAAGKTVWEKTYGGDLFDRGKAIIPSSDGGFVVLAETKSVGAGDRDVHLLKVDADGQELWARTYGGPAQERANAIQPTADGGYLLIGGTASSGAGGSDVYLVRTDAAGDELWSRTYGSEVEEEGFGAHETADGGFLVLAERQQGTGLYTAQNPDIYLLRIDAAGEEVWSQVWEEEGVQGGYELLPTSDGNYLITGFLSPTGSDADADFLFTLIDGDGQVIWSKPFGEANRVDYGTDVIELSTGGYLLTGMVVRGGKMAIPLVRTDAQGEVLWRRDLFEGPGARAGMRVLETPGGGYLVIGQISEARGPFDTVVIKTDATGEVYE
jgi:dipeptidyl aminopeptidase/acylaminoacyl peptidase